MITKEQKKFLAALNGSPVFRLKEGAPGKIRITERFVRSASGWRLYHNPVIGLPPESVVRGAFVRLLSGYRYTVEVLTEEEVLSRYATLGGDRPPVQVVQDPDEIRARCRPGVCYVAMPHITPFPAAEYPVLWIWDLEHGLGLEYRRNGLEGLVTRLRDIKSESPESFEDEVHVDVSGRFPTLHDAEVYARGLAYAQSGEAYGGMTDFIAENADVFVTDPGEVSALTEFFTREGLL